MIRKICCILAPLICTLPMISPASSLAETPGLVTSQPLVEVRFVMNEESKESTIVEPRLPRRDNQLRSVEQQYYTELYTIAAEMCTEVSGLAKTVAVTYTGFNSDLVQYDRVRGQLNRLLAKFKLGLAPDIEDFTNDAGLEFFHYPRIIKHPPKGPYLEEVGSWEFEPSDDAGTNFCSFTVINPPQMK